MYETESPSTSATRPTVSIVIPAYKVAPFIRETLDSVFVQTFTGFEVLVINDGSPDVEELERALSLYSKRIIYLSQKNKGAAGARNTGLRHAQGQFVAFLDGDDVWFPEFLAEQLALITSNGGYDLAYADAVNFGDPAAAGRSGMATNPSSGTVTFESLISGRCNVITSTVLARREPILSVGLFDESFPNSQDFDLWLRLIRDGRARITYQRKILVRRRIYQGSLASDPLKSFAGEIAVLRKVLQRSDLSELEQSTVKQTIARRQATVSVIEAKGSLSRGDFVAATHSFAAANETLHCWKLRLVLLWLKIAPRLLRRLFKLRAS